MLPEILFKGGSQIVLRGPQAIGFVESVVVSMGCSLGNIDSAFIFYLDYVSA